MTKVSVSESSAKRRVKPDTSGNSNYNWWSRVLDVRDSTYEDWLCFEKTYLIKTVKPGSLVLDVGCGDGRNIADLSPINSRLIGLDIDAEAIWSARRRLGGAANTQLIVADASAMPFADKTFDSVVCLGATFGNFADFQQQILREMARVLKEDGRIVLSVYSETALPKRLDVYDKVGVPIMNVAQDGTVLLGARGEIVSEQFWEEKLAKLFDTVGFEIIEIERANQLGVLCTAKRKKISFVHPAVEHYTAEGYKSVENTSSIDFQRYMADEKAVITGIEGSKDRTFVDLGAGNGRVIHEISAVARNVIAIDINRDMLEGLTKRALGLSNVKPVLGDMLQLESILSSEDVQRPVLLLLQNTLAIVDRQILAEMRKVAKNLNGDIVISLLKQEALKESGIPFYRTIPGVVGEPDLEKTDFQKGDFVTKTGYRSKWWRPEERESIRRFFEGDGVVVKEYEGSNYYILHVSYPPPI